MKKYVNYFMTVAFLLIAGFALMRGNISIVNAAESEQEDTVVCENGHTPAKEWVLRRYARVKSDGVKVKLCQVCGAEIQREAIPYIASVKVVHSKLVCNGKAFAPQIQVTDRNGKKIAASNYTVKYSDNVWPGRAVATVTFKGNYKGEIERAFKIYLGKVAITKVENTAWGTRIAWSAPGNRSYGVQIFRSTNGGKYENLFTTPVSGGRWFMDRNARTPGVKYTYKVCVIEYQYGDSAYGSASTTPPKSVVCKEKRLSIPSVTNTSKGVKISWKWVPYATYYEVRGSGYKDGVLKNNLLIARVKAGDALSIIDKNVLARTIKRDKKGNIVEKAPVNYYVTAVVSTQTGNFRSSSPRTKGKWVATRKNNVPALRTK